MFAVGDLVVSLKGHDEGRLFIITAIEDGRAVISDGKLRKTADKKTKNFKHIKPTGLNTDLINKVPQYAADANIRREIKRLKTMI